MNVNENVANSNVHAEAILYCGNKTNLYKYMKGQKKKKLFLGNSRKRNNNKKFHRQTPTASVETDATVPVLPEMQRISR